MERYVITQLKITCGQPYTTKHEGMLTDYALHEERDAEFRPTLADTDKHDELVATAIEKRQKDSKGGGGAAAASALPFKGGKAAGKAKAGGAGGGAAALCDISVHVLTQGFWPSEPRHPLTLPPQMARARDVFEGWARTEHAERRYQWIYQLGDVSMRVEIPGEKTAVYNASMSAYQATALLHFSGTTAAISFENARQRMDMDETTAKRVLHSLSCGKHRLLKKSGKSNSISTTDEFETNPAFKCRQRAFKIPFSGLTKGGSAGGGGKGATAEVLNQRGFQVDSCVVRIMKARKRLAHSALISEVMTQVRNFKAEAKLVKQRIAGLLEREYLRRDDDDPGVYIYMP